MFLPSSFTILNVIWCYALVGQKTYVGVVSSSALMFSEYQNESFVVQFSQSIQIKIKNIYSL